MLCTSLLATIVANIFSVQWTHSKDVKGSSMPLSALAHKDSTKHLKVTDIAKS